MGQAEQRSSEYDCREMVSDDRQGFLELYETVRGHERSREWFQWRFEDNPYVDETPMVVAEHDGEIVGAEPCLAFRLRVGSETVTAFQPADWIVHPDHHKRGALSEMTERLLDQYEDGPAQLYFNFPGEAVVPELETFDWRLRDGPRTYYRIQNPHRILERGSDSKREFRSTDARNRGLVGMPLTGGYLRLRDRFRRPVDGVDIERYASVPATLLTALARNHGDEIRLARDEAYYRWRFDNPRWETTTYVARQGGEPVAACIACSERSGDIRTTAIVDVVPRDERADTDAYRALVEAVVDDAEAADVLQIGDGPVPEAVLRAAGFVPDDDFPMSALATRTPLAVRPTAGTASEGFDIGGVDPSECAWDLALGDRDST